MTTGRINQVARDEGEQPTKRASDKHSTRDGDHTPTPGIRHETDAPRELHEADPQRERPSETRRRCSPRGGASELPRGRRGSNDRPNHQTRTTGTRDELTKRTQARTLTDSPPKCHRWPTEDDGSSNHSNERSPTLSRGSASERATAQKD